MKKCWAEILGGCSQGFSKEHYIGRGQLFDQEKVKTQGLHPSLEDRSMHVDNLKAHILCKKHNNDLSEADQEAINFKTALESLSQCQDTEDILEGSGLWTPEQYNVKGSLFGRWLCKLHCNFVTLKDIDPPEYYVRSAFGQRADPVPRFYVRAQFHDNLGY